MLTRSDSPDKNEESGTAPRVYKLLLVPKGAVIPEDIRLPVLKAEHIVGALGQYDGEESILPVTVREFQLLLEFKDLIPTDLKAIIGLSGAMYNSIWASYTSTLERVTLDNLRAEQQTRDAAAADAGQVPLSAQEIRARAMPTLTRRHTPEPVEPEDTPAVDDNPGM